MEKPLVKRGPGWYNEFAVTHPDEIPTSAKSLNYPGDMRWYMSSKTNKQTNEQQPQKTNKKQQKSNPLGLSQQQSNPFGLS